MNILKLLAQKVGLVAAMVLLWILDDLVVFLPDQAVFAIIASLLNIIGKGDRFNSLHDYWIGTGKGK